MKFETLKGFTVMDGKNPKNIRAGKGGDSRDYGISDKSMAELARGGFVHIEKGQADAPAQVKADKGGK